VSYACVLRASQSGGTVDWTINHSTAVGGESIALHAYWNRILVFGIFILIAMRVRLGSVRNGSDASVSSCPHGGTPSCVDRGARRSAPRRRRATASSTRRPTAPTPDRTRCARCRWRRAHNARNGSRVATRSIARVSVRSAGRQERGVRISAASREETTGAGAAARLGRGRAGRRGGAHTQDIRPKRTPMADAHFRTGPR
jgi:hypothetical protein